MTPVTDEEFEELLVSFRREAVHLEMRDAYGTAVELPYMAKWAAGEPDDLQWLQGWMVTDPDTLAQMNIPDGETAVEIPDRMIKFFRQEDRDTGNG